MCNIVGDVLLRFRYLYNFSDLHDYASIFMLPVSSSSGDFVFISSLNVSIKIYYK